MSFDSPGPSGIHAAELLTSDYNDTLERYMRDEFDEFMQITGKFSV